MVTGAEAAGLRSPACLSSAPDPRPGENATRREFALKARHAPSPI